MSVEILIKQLNSVLLIGNDVFGTFRSMELIIYISLGFLSFTSIVLLRNLFDFKGLQSVKYSRSTPFPFVSICIPARNEEAVIERCVKSALSQDYSKFEVLVLDDQSTDQTPDILHSFSKHSGNFRVLQGTQKPEDWLGKPWACHQLSRQAKGEILVFMDADVWLEPQAVAKSVRALEHNDAITVWPQQHFGSFWEHMIIPLIYHALYTLLPAKYVERKPRWLPQFLHQRLSPEFAAACGQFIAFQKSAYNKIDGHTSVKNHIVEDVELAKNLKRHNLQLTMYHGAEIVHCRMYRSHKELWSGLRKNFFAGFKRNVFSFVAMALLHLIVFIGPVLGLFIGMAEGTINLTLLSAASLLIIFLQRFLLDRVFKWNSLFSLLHPISVLWFQWLGMMCLKDHFTGKKATWKGRKV